MSNHVTEQQLSLPTVNLEEPGSFSELTIFESLALSIASLGRLVDTADLKALTQRFIADEDFWEYVKLTMGGLDTENEMIDEEANEISEN